MPILYELIKDEAGFNIAIGNSVEMTEADAIKAIDAGTHKHKDAPIGELPPEWKIKQPGKKQQINAE